MVLVVVVVVVAAFLNCYCSKVVIVAVASVVVDALRKHELPPKLQHHWL